jgi:hypothetical protein
MNEVIDKAASGGDMLIWMLMFSIMVVGVGYLAWKDRNKER